PGGTAVAASPRVMLEGSGPASDDAQDRGALGRDVVVRFRVVLSSRASAVLKGLAKARAERRRVPPGGFMTPRQVADRFGPSSGAVSKVTSWLRKSGLVVEQVPGDRSFLSVSGTAEQVERA